MLIFRVPFDMINSVKNCKNVIIFSTADWDNPFWTNKQHTAVQLANLGYRVLYIESLGLRRPTVKAHDIGRIWKRLFAFFKGSRKVQKNIWVYSPLVLPFHSIRWVQRLNSWALLSMLKFLKFRRRFKDAVVWTYNPMVLDLAEALKPVLLVYHSVDDLTAAPRLPKEEIEFQEARLLKAADVVFVTSPALYDKYKRMIEGKLHFFPNVADYSHFSRARLPRLEVPEDLMQISRPRIGFVGAISSYKVNFPLLKEMANLRPNWNIVMIGKVGEGDPYTDVSDLSGSNIHFLGPKPYAQLPNYVKGFDVCIIPSLHNDYTKAMFPMKFFEYMAAGKMIVATDLPALKDYQGAFLMAKDTTEFIEQIEAVLKGQKTFKTEMDQLAKQNTWESRLERMLQIIEESPGPVGLGKASSRSFQLINSQDKPSL